MHAESVSGSQRTEIMHKVESYKGVEVLSCLTAQIVYTLGAFVSRPHESVAIDASLGASGRSVWQTPSIFPLQWNEIFMEAVKNKIIG